MNIRKRTKLAVPVFVMPGDSVQVTHRQVATENATGKVVWEQERVLIYDTITETATYDEAFIFDGELDGRKTLGGGLIEAGE